MGKDWGEKIRTLGALVALVGTLLSAILWGFDKLPVAKASEVLVLVQRVDRIETGFKGMSLDQKQSLELQLMTQIDTISAKLEGMARTGEYQDLRNRRTELEQRLGVVRADMQSLRGSQ